MTNPTDPQDREATPSEEGVETTPAPVAEEVAPPAEAAASAPADADAEGAADAGDDADAEGDDAGGEGDAEHGAEAGEAGGTKKKRRRKRKKKGAAAPMDPAKAAQVPFLRYFEGTAGAKRHAFAVGEIVAGRVERVEAGVAVLDLFGKAMAVMDALEPLEIAELPELPAPHGDTSADDLASAAEAVHAEAEAAADEATSAGSVEAATAEEPPAAPEPVAEAPAAPEAAAETSPATEAASATADGPEAADAPETAAEGAAAPAEAATAEAPAEDKPAIPLVSEQPKAEAPPALGTIFRGRVGAVSESGHIAIMNRAVDRSVAKAAIRAAQDERRRVEGLVYGFNRGGFDVLIEGIRAFCPASGMALVAIDDPHDYLGQKVEFTVPPSKGGKSIVVSRRTVLEKELRRAAKERLKTLAIGEVLDGVITQVRDYGLLVDIGEGVEGLVHQSEVSWSRGTRPGDVGRPGDNVKVKVLRVQPITRKERHGRVSLSLRACLPDPWDEHKDVVREGHAQKATVVRTTEFGAFMKLAPGIEGLLHISELGGKDVKHAKQVVEEGEELAVIVERVDREQRRISLSRLSQSDTEKLEAGQADQIVSARPPKQGAHVFVIIERVEHHGILAQVEGVAGRRGRAYIPNRELADDGGDRRKTFAPGARVEVKVVAVERDGGLKCSVRARLQDEERKAVKDYRREAARQGFGTFGDLLRQKLGGDRS